MKKVNHRSVSLFLIAGIFLFFSCSSENKDDAQSDRSGVSLIVLGNVQDGGSPHIGCMKNCCRRLFDSVCSDRKVTSLGLIDWSNKQTFLFEASPDMTRQLAYLNHRAEAANNRLPDGIFISHAHIGHYTGLMYLGREAMGADKAKVYAMPRMADFLKNNGPWSQLISLNNIVVDTLQHEKSLFLNKNLIVMPFLVPHRDEFSETVGYRIAGINKKALFIPDIDKWSKWNKNIVDEISSVDYAFIDATFFDSGELDKRDISEIPHPFVSESIELFKSLPSKEKNKIWFIHLNHSNPLLDPHSTASEKVAREGMHVARQGSTFAL